MVLPLFFTTNSFLLEYMYFPFQKWQKVQESKEEFAKVTSLVNMIETLPGASGPTKYSKTCVRQPPLKLTLMVNVERWLSYKDTCHVILLAKLHDMYLYKTTTFFRINHYLKSVSKVALLHRFYCTCNDLKTTSNQRCFYVKTLNQRWIDVISTVCARSEMSKRTKLKQTETDDTSIYDVGGSVGCAFDWWTGGRRFDFPPGPATFFPRDW